MSERKIIGFGGDVTTLEKLEDGRVRFKARVVRPGVFNRLRITPELLLKKLETWSRVDGFLTHPETPFDASQMAIEHEKAYLEGDWITVQGITLDTNAGRDAAKLYLKHKVSLENGYKGVLAPSIGFEITDSKGKLEDEEYTREVLDWEPDHIAYGRKGHQAVPDAETMAFNADKFMAQFAKEEEEMMAFESKEVGKMIEPTPTAQVAAPAPVVAPPTPVKTDEDGLKDGEAKAVAELKAESERVTYANQVIDVLKQAALSTDGVEKLPMAELTKKHIEAQNALIEKSKKGADPVPAGNGEPKQRKYTSLIW